MESFCGNCGLKLELEDRFCPKCGAPVDTPTQQDSQPDNNIPPAELSHQGSKQRAVKSKRIFFRRLPVASVLIVIGTLLVVAFFGLKVLSLHGAPGSIGILALSPDGKMLASTASDNKLQLWDIEKQSSTARTSLSHSIKAAAWSQDGKTLAIAYSNQIKLISVSNLSQNSSFDASTDKTIALCLDPDKETLYGLTEGFGVNVWDINKKERLGGLPDKPERRLDRANFSCDCKRIVTLEMNNPTILAVYQLIDMSTLQRIRFDDDVPKFVGLNANGTMAICLTDSELNTWPVGSNKRGKGDDPTNPFSGSGWKPNDSLDPFGLGEWEPVDSSDFRRSIVKLAPVAQKAQRAFGNGGSRFAIGLDQGQIQIYDKKGRLSSTLRHGTPLGLALTFMLD